MDAAALRSAPYPTVNTRSIPRKTIATKALPLSCVPARIPPCSSSSQSPQTRFPSTASWRAPVAGRCRRPRRGDRTGDRSDARMPGAHMSFVFRQARRVEQTALRFRRTGYRDRRWAMADGLRANEYEVIGNVHLEPVSDGVSVNGVVISTSGSPVARAQVQLDSAIRRRGYRAMTDGAGRFTLEKVEAGSDYRLWVRPQSGFKDTASRKRPRRRRDTAARRQLTPISVATLNGRMVTPEGASVPGFTMWLTSAYGAGPRSLSLTSDARGVSLLQIFLKGRSRFRPGPRLRFLCRASTCRPAGPRHQTSPLSSMSARIASKASCSRAKAPPPAVCAFLLNGRDRSAAS